MCCLRKIRPGLAAVQQARRGRDQSRLRRRHLSRPRHCSQQRYHCQTEHRMARTVWQRHQRKGPCHHRSRSAGGSPRPESSLSTADTALARPRRCPGLLGCIYIFFLEEKVWLVTQQADVKFPYLSTTQRRRRRRRLLLPQSRPVPCAARRHSRSRARPGRRPLCS